ncbi:hypothetical protein BT93_C1607 [Corymbia citriodora subsp. variegata]|nr:hypothetical protein BT93_C1607 [Corymbia citriodora subsp. variegata]
MVSTLVIHIVSSQASPCWQVLIRHLDALSLSLSLSLSDTYPSSCCNVLQLRLLGQLGQDYSAQLQPRVRKVHTSDFGLRPSCSSSSGHLYRIGCLSLCMLTTVYQPAAHWCAAPTMGFW